MQLSVIECKGDVGSSSQLLDLVICARNSALDNVKLLQVCVLFAATCGAEHAPLSGGDDVLVAALIADDSLDCCRLLLKTWVSVCRCCRVN